MWDVNLNFFLLDNNECLLYQTCDFYGDYGCQTNRNCKIQDEEGELEGGLGCLECESGYWMLSNQHPCRQCVADCNKCKDYIGCIEGACNQGYDWQWDDKCGYGKCVAI